MATTKIALAHPADVTPEILDFVRAILDTDYEGVQVDWEDVFTRLDGHQLADGTVVEIDDRSPAAHRIRATLEA